MKGSIFTFLFILLQTVAFTQTHRYIPLDLDTTSFWIIKEGRYYGGDECFGEKLCYVEKDTTIQSHKYWKINSYLTKAGRGNDPLKCSQVNGSRFIVYLREDTTQRMVYRWKNNKDVPYLNYNLQKGDSVLDPNTLKYAQVSIEYETIMGVTRRIQTIHYPNGVHQRIVEGIGAFSNFPYEIFGEWGRQMVQLTCYSKQGQTLFCNECPCLRKAPVPLSNQDLNPVKSSHSIHVFPERIEISNQGHQELHITLLSTDGRELKSFDTQEESTSLSTSNLQNGLYFILATSPEETVYQKVYVR
ncbi:T9SS type A sorting domain-containing protein [bacterium SCSIO 12741]|nr:T9SS type A sorting domain-containing protein [bacterium SCSIO 12741]